MKDGVMMERLSKDLERERRNKGREKKRRGTQEKGWKRRRKSF